MGLLIVVMCIFALLLFLGYDYTMRTLLKKQKHLIIEQQIMIEKLSR